MTQRAKFWSNSEVKLLPESTKDSLEFYSNSENQSQITYPFQPRMEYLERELEGDRYSGSYHSRVSLTLCLAVWGNTSVRILFSSVSEVTSLCSCAFVDTINTPTALHSLPLYKQMLPWNKQTNDGHGLGMTVELWCILQTTVLMCRYSPSHLCVKGKSGAVPLHHNWWVPPPRLQPKPESLSTNEVLAHHREHKELPHQETTHISSIIIELCRSEN